MADAVSNLKLCRCLPLLLPLCQAVVGQCQGIGIHASQLPAGLSPAGCRYIDNMTSERVDAEGISNIAKAAQGFLPAQTWQPEVEQVLSMRSAQDLEKWEKLDDVIMGGKSGSFLQSAHEVHGFQGGYDHKSDYQFEGAVWRGELITEGGGFCGARTKVQQLCTSLQQNFCQGEQVLTIPAAAMCMGINPCTVCA